MTLTPPRTPSRSNTPSPSGLSRHPSLRTSSTSSPHARFAHSRTPSQATLSALPLRLHANSVASPAVSSPASSVFSVDLNEGILVRDSVEDDIDVAESQEQVHAVFAESPEEGEERKKVLRDHLRRTLSQKNTNPRPRQGHQDDQSTHEDTESLYSTGEQFPQRQYFVFTDAGKPVFVSRPASATEDLASVTGITSAIISVFADSTLFPSPSPSSVPDKIRCINAGSTRITFFLRPPLYYVCVSKWKEPESVARMHLEYLHLQIISVLTASQLHRIFERRTNFDLRRLLEGAETFLHTLLFRLQSSFAFCATLSAISTLRVDPSIRTRVGDALVTGSKAAGLDILYALIVSGDSVITILRPKKHSVHPTDLHILLNALHTSSIATNAASWLPICLPKFNSQGFVHAYVCFPEHDQPETFHASTNGKGPLPATTASIPLKTDTPSSPAPALTATNIGGPPDVETPGITSEMVPQSQDTASAARDGQLAGDQSNANEKALGHAFGDYRAGLALITVSLGKDFDAVRRWSDGVLQTLHTTGTLSLLRTAVDAGQYGCSELGIPGLRHFLYKSRLHVQVTSPMWEDEYQSLEDQRRLITLYQNVHDAIHAKSGQGGTLKLQYIRTHKEAVMGWVAQPFELYLALSPRLPKSAAVGAANAIARWAKREEGRLFLRDAPVI